MLELSIHFSIVSYFIKNVGAVYIENQLLGSDSDIDFDPELFAIQSY